MAYRLGRLAPKPVALGCLDHYLTAPLPAPPAEVGAPQLSWPMADNDRLGCCTISGVVHTDQATASESQEPWTYAGDQAVESTYFGLTGGADTGLAETDVLRAWQQKGLFGCQLAAFAPLAVQHVRTIRQAVWLCGGVYMGVLVTQADQEAFAAGEAWTPSGQPPLGGHCIVYVGYTDSGFLAVTWGGLAEVTWAWHAAQAEEAYAVITQEVKERGSLRGVNLAALERDLNRLERA